MATPDVTVMGAGIFGLSCAWEFLGRGAQVQVIDPAGIGGGASGGIVGALSPHVPDAWNPKKQFQLDSLLAAEAWWAKIEAASGLSPGYARTGRLQPLADDAAVALARHRATGAEALWQGRAEWRVIAVPSGDWTVPSPTGLGIFDSLTARIAPRRALAALAAAVRNAGATISTAGEPRGAILWATGVAGLADLSDALGRPVGRGVKGQAALLRHEASEKPQLFADAVHIVPHGDGTVAVGSTSERVYSSENDTDDQLDALIDHVRALVPALRDAPVTDRWSGVRARAATRAPMLGAWPGRASHFVANGGFKIGFGIAPKVAEVMADLILDRRDTIPLGFRVEDNL